MLAELTGTPPNLQ